MVTRIKTIEWKFRDVSVEYPKLKRFKKLTCWKDGYNVLKELYPEDNTKEHFIVLWLGSSNKLIGYEIISVGNLNSNVVHPREVFRSAIVASANSIILSHNHPSGNVEPSNEDIDITKRLIEASKIINIPIYDHIIISNLPGEEKYLSFADRHLL